MPTPSLTGTTSSPTTNLAGLPLADDTSTRLKPIAVPVISKPTDVLAPTRTGSVPKALAGENELATRQAQAQAIVALKAIVEGTTLDAQARLRTKDPAQLSALQLGNALKAIFGADASPQLLTTQGNAFDLSAGNKGFDALKALIAAFKISGKDLALKSGRVSGDVEIKGALDHLFGTDVLAVAAGKLKIVDNAIAGAAVALKAGAQLGPLASIEGALIAGAGPAGLNSVRALGAFKALLAGSTMSVSAGGGLTLERKKEGSQFTLSEAEFQAALGAVFGKNNITADAKLSWTSGQGVDAQLAAAFARTFGKASIGLSGELNVKGGLVDGALGADLSTMFGDATVVVRNAIQFRDGTFQSLAIESELNKSFGKNASLATLFRATVDREGLASAEATAAFKALMGSANIDASGGLTFNRKGLSAAEFRASLKAVFGDAAIDASIDTQWTPGGDLAVKVDQFKAVYNNFELDGAGQIVRRANGKIDADVKAAVTATLGTNSTVTAGGSIAFRDSSFAGATLEADLKQKFGANTSVNAEIKATIDAEGRVSGEMIAAFKTLLAGGKVKVDGTGKLVVTNDGRISQAAFSAAISTIFAKDNVDPKVFEAISLDAKGTLIVDHGKLDGQAEAKIKAVFGPATTLSSEGAIVFKDGALVSAKVKEEIQQKFGSSGSLDATVEASFSDKGLVDATVFASAKVLAGNVTFQGDTKIKLAAGKVEQLSAALSVLAGQTVKADVNGVIDLDGLGKFKSATFSEDFKAIVSGTTVSSNGTWTIKDGALNGKMNTSLERHFGERIAVSGGGLITFNEAGLKLEEIQGALALKKLAGVDLNANFRIRGGSVDAAITVGALQTLKQLDGGKGSITLKEDGSIQIKDNKIDRAEVGALFSAAVGQKVNLTVDGRLIYQNGQPLAGELAGNLKLAWDKTSLDVNGKLVLKDGQLSLADGAKLGAVFGGAKLQAGGAITVLDADRRQVDFTAKALGGGLNESGSLIFDKGKLVSATATTSLVFGSKDKPDFALHGLVGIAPGNAKVDVGAEMNAGILTVAAGVAAEVKVTPYQPQPNDPDAALRQAISKETGAQFQQWSGNFSGHVSVGVNATVGPAGVPISVGIRAGAGQELKATAIAIAPATDKAAPMVTILRPPASAEDVEKMHPGESWQDSAAHQFLIGGNVAIGSRIPGGVAGVTLGGDISFVVNGNLDRKITCKAPGVIEVEIGRAEGSERIEALSLSAKLDAGALAKSLPGGAAVKALEEKALPILAKAAEASFTKTWQQSKKDGAAFKMVFDLSNPGAREALTRLLNDDFTLAQQRGVTGDGVVLLNAVRTQIRAESEDATLKLAGMTAQNWSQWIDKKTEQVSGGQITFEEEVDGKTLNKALLPWNGSWNSEVKLTHRQTRALSADESKDFGGISAATTIGRPFDEGSIADMNSFVTVSLGAQSPKTSLERFKSYVGTSEALLDALAQPIGERGTFGVLATAIDGGVAPDKNGGLIDGRFGATSFGVQAVINRDGLKKIISKSRDEIIDAYLSLSGGAQTEAALVISRQGLAAKIAEAKGCRAVPLGGGDFALIGKDGAGKGTLADSQLAQVQDWMLEHVALDKQMRIDARENIKTSIGNFDLTGMEYTWAQTIKRRAQAFADRIEEAAEFVRQNTNPAPGTKPIDTEAFYDRLDLLFRKIMQNETAARLAFVALAGKETTLVRGGIAMPPGVVEQMKAKGVSLVADATAPDAVFAAGNAAIDSDLTKTLPPLARN